MIELSPKDRKYLYELVDLGKIEKEESNHSQEILIEKGLAEISYKEVIIDPETGDYTNKTILLIPTNEGKRYRSIRNEKIRERFTIPILVSLATNAIIWGVRYLLKY